MVILFSRPCEFLSARTCFLFRECLGIVLAGASRLSCYGYSWPLSLFRCCKRGRATARPPGCCALCQPAPYPASCTCLLPPSRSDFFQGSVLPRSPGSGWKPRHGVKPFLRKWPGRWEGGSGTAGSCPLVLGFLICEPRLQKPGTAMHLLLHTCTHLGRGQGSRYHSLGTALGLVQGGRWGQARRHRRHRGRSCDGGRSGAPGGWSLCSLPVCPPRTHTRVYSSMSSHA